MASRSVLGCRPERHRDRHPTYHAGHSSIMLQYMTTKPLAAAALLLLAALAPTRAADKLPTEDDFYPITRFEVPEGVVLEVGAFQLLPDDRLALATRRGEIWMIEQPFSKQVKAGQYKRFAHGLHEVLGLAYRDGWLYVTQRSDVSRLRDTDGDGVADDFELVNEEWEVTGDYHEYAFGS
jgi:glucose/arabinose dehydrogenase